MVKKVKRICGKKRKGFLFGDNIKVGVGLFFYVVSLVFGILSSVMASILSIHLMIAGLALLEYKMFLVGFGLWSVLIFCLTMGEVIGKET